MTVRATLGYTAAGVTLAVAALTPFVLMGTFSRGVAALGLHVDAVYSGGPVARTIPMSGYSIAVHEVVRPHMLQADQPFVQMDWKPVSALPREVDEVVDLDGDGKPDVRVTFAVPQDAKGALHADVLALNPAFESLRNLSRDRFSRLIVRVDDAIVVRVPVKGNRE